MIDNQWLKIVQVFNYDILNSRIKFSVINVHILKILRSGNKV
jgi:hypothetical protein